MNKKNLLILVTNDDGIDAPGIHQLIDYVKDMGEIVAIAPDSPNSGQTSAISVNKVLKSQTIPIITEHACAPSTALPWTA